MFFFRNVTHSPNPTPGRIFKLGHLLGLTPGADPGFRRGGFVHSEGGVSYRKFRSGSKLLQGPGQINKQKQIADSRRGGGFPITQKKNLYPRLHPITQLCISIHPVYINNRLKTPLSRGVGRIFGGGCRGGGGGVPRSAKEANKPNKRATELKPRPCAHQGSMFRPY